MSEPSQIPDVRVEQPLTLTIFGATGDLTRRKLLPGLYVMYTGGLLPDAFTIVGFARREHDDASFRALMADMIREHSREPVDEARLSAFLGHLVYHRSDMTEAAGYAALRDRFTDESAFPGDRVYYLSVSPDLFKPVICNLKGNGLISPFGDRPWTRVVIEKPFGKDLASGRALNQAVLHELDESQVYRIDHYLGKETAQNVLSFRFANTIFEPVFNNQYVDHIQITASETVGMESGRGGYYDTSGALRDMLQNHLMQLLCLVTMEPPSGLAADAVRNEKVKILQSIRPHSAEEVRTSALRAQYSGGMLGDREVPGYRQEERVPPDSKTATFVGARFEIENWRWAGVPMFLRSGKRMAAKTTSIAVQFKVPPLKLFNTVQCQGDVCDMSASNPNLLTFHLAPHSGISLGFSAKRPAMQVVVEDAEMDFRYDEKWTHDLPEAYERLLLDVMRGDSTLFTRSDEVEAAWTAVDPILNAWANDDSIPVHEYAPGSWGPQAADALLRDPARRWLNG